jgi:hypothetical protein
MTNASSLNLSELLALECAANPNIDKAVSLLITYEQL